MQTPAMMSLLLVSVGLMEALQSHPITRRGLFSQERPLDMAPTSFDDQYAGCAAAMTAALPDLNRTEFQANKVYADSWVLASSQWQERKAWGPEWGLSHTLMSPPPPGFRDEHGVALLAYTANTPLHKEFNAALREAGRTRVHYLQHFSFKTFHFLLTEALQLLSKAQRSPQCRQVFRGDATAQHFGEETFFGIWTCLGVPIRGYSFFPEEEEVLIPPFETFQVINSSRPAQGPTRIYLRALGKHSMYNCEYIKGERGLWVSTCAEDKQCKSRSCRLGNSAVGQGPLSTVWSLPLLLWFLVGESFQRVQASSDPSDSEQPCLPPLPNMRTSATCVLYSKCSQDP
ncbi:hypothetical protein QTO34_003874 [Cnephaeus nilssonii]|uniref:NAD(P)(+)--arginine ADP-ribosyltransferase n=1 Tax=Cnephaeus nilssonii TaxID=3371016 RepID=A0AA40LLQ3_CNENI|nr:hypothetical protein QTO34_003874 [Eptesicus nilssonii]